MDIWMGEMEDPIPWLLESGVPSIVYQTRKDLLGPKSTAAETRQAAARVMRSGAAAAILSRQSTRGNWKVDRGGYYGPKFFSTHWSMMLLAELGADGNDARYRRGVEYMLEATQEEARDGLRRKSYGWSCFWGNLLRYALRSVAPDEPRTEAVIRYVAADTAGKNCACRINDGKACAWGAARALWGLAAVPEPRRSAAVKRAIRRGVRFLLDDHSLAEADYPVRARGRINPLWFSLNFPLFYQADILFALRVLDELGALKRRGARPALDWLAARRRPDGRWKGRSPFRARTWREMGAPEETDRWVTLQALRILRHAGRSV
jgi:hypothetical protein